MDTPKIDTNDALLARLIKLTQRREDFISECFAAVLQADIHAAAHFWRIVASRLNSVPTTGDTAVETQVRCGAGTCRIDMLIRRAGQRVAVEHKLDAPQARGQLVKYLSLPKREVSHVALVAADYQQVSKLVLDNPRYLRPTSGHSHFLWADFYTLLQQSANRGFDVARSTLALFDQIGLQPAHPLIGDLRTSDRQLRMTLDSRLYAAWQPLLNTLQPRWAYAGSCIRKDRQAEIYIEDGPSSTLRVVWLDPFSNPGSLRIRLKTDSLAKRDRMLRRLERRCTDFPYGRYLGLQPTKLLWKGGRGWYWAIDGRIPWHKLLAKCEGRGGREKMPKILKRFVLDVMAAAT